MRYIDIESNILIFSSIPIFRWLSTKNFIYIYILMFLDFIILSFWWWGGRSIWRIRWIVSNPLTRRSCTYYMMVAALWLTTIWLAKWRNFKELSHYYESMITKVLSSQYKYVRRLQNVTNSWFFVLHDNSQSKYTDVLKLTLSCQIMKNVTEFNIV